MSVLKISGAALAVALFASPAIALTITNRDASDYTVNIKTGAALAEVVVPGGGMAEQPCEPECVVSVAGLKGEESAAGDDKLIIYDGKLHKEEE